MPEKNQDKIRKLKLFDQDKDLALFTMQMEIAEALKKLSDAKIDKIPVTKGIEILKGKDGFTPKKGKDYFTNKDILSVAKKIMSLVKLPKDGKRGKDGSTPKKGKDYFTKKEIKEFKEDIFKRIEIPDNNLGPDDIRDMLETLTGDERLDKSAIRGLKEMFDKLEEKIKNVSGGKVGHGGLPNNSLQVADLSSQCNGVTKTFSVPLHRKAIKVEGTQFPVVFRPDIDFTTANYTLTLTDEVGAPKTGQTLIFYYIK